jgi:hypothetical protein
MVQRHNPKTQAQTPSLGHPQKRTGRSEIRPLHSEIDKSVDSRGFTDFVSGLFCIRFESVDSKTGYGSEEEVGSYADCFVLDGSDGWDWGPGLGDGAGLVAALPSKTKDCSTTWGHSC